MNYILFIDHKCKNIDHFLYQNRFIDHFLRCRVDVLVDI